MVKERISVAGSEMVILIQFSDNPVSADKILEQSGAYHMISLRMGLQ